MSAKDRFGNDVRVGDKVRLIKVDSQLLSQLSAEERERVESMQGDIFSIYEIDEYGHPWIQKWFGEKQSHSLALMPEEMEKIL